MGKLIGMVGNCGTGKTTLANALQAATGGRLYLEQHVERPYQKTFFEDRATAGALNQLDYLMLRAEQEADIRSRAGLGIQDGGLEQDFQLFTRLFLRKGYLNEAAFELCERFYCLTRRILPAPDIMICLQAPLDVLLERRARRARPIDIVQPEDLTTLMTLEQDWLSLMEPERVICLPSGQDDPGFSQSLPGLLEKIQPHLG